MKQEEAVTYLMKEFKASEDFRGYFEQKVSGWMGVAKNVLPTDLEGIRNSILNDR